LGKFSLEIIVTVIISSFAAHCENILFEAMVTSPKTGLAISKITLVPSLVAVSTSPVLPAGSS
jgi:hypothetical protein